jgi:hypothetical protein
MLHGPPPSGSAILSLAAFSPHSYEGEQLRGRNPAALQPSGGPVLPRCSEDHRIWESRPPVTRATGLGGIYHHLAVQAACSAALLGWCRGLAKRVTLVGVAFLLLGVAALLGGVALLYRPELPWRLVAWLTKRDDLPLTGG